MDWTTQQLYQFNSKYSRWREQDQRRETYSEAVDRAMSFIDQATNYVLDGETNGQWQGMVEENSGALMWEVQHGARFI